MISLKQKHVDKEPEDIEAWLELALTRIDFDLHCTDIDAYNEVSQLQSKGCCMFGFLRCQLLRLISRHIKTTIVVVLWALRLKRYGIIKQRLFRRASW